MIKVLIAEDTKVSQELVKYILDQDPEIEVTEIVNNGREAVEAAIHKKPDLILMDINMPVMNGWEATKKLMETAPLPIVMISATVDIKEVEITFKALNAGVVAIIAKPRGIGHPDFQEQSSNLINTVKAMSEVKVVKRWIRPQIIEKPTPVKPLEITPRAVAIGASTGGPAVIKSILSSLPKSFPLPILIVQHMTVGFTEGFIEWLKHDCRLPINIAQNKKKIIPGHVYIAPDDFQMEISFDERISLTTKPPQNGVRPSVSYLFKSIRDVYGKNAIGILLTGMGIDGARELKLMKEKGALTIVQDKESSVVFGMPGQALEIGAAKQVLSPEEIVSVLISCFDRRKNREGRQ